MGFFSGLFGKNQTPQFKNVGFEEKLPQFLQKQGKEIGTGAFNLLSETIGRGETPQEARLFQESRRQTRDEVARLGRDLGLSLDRAGLGSSGLKDRRMASVLLGLGDILSRQDAQRATQLLQQRLGAANQGLDAALRVSKQTDRIPIIRQKGLFDGFGTELLGGAITGGASKLGEKFGF